MSGCPQCGSYSIDSRKPCQSCLLKENLALKEQLGIGVGGCVLEGEALVRHTQGIRQAINRLAQHADNFYQAEVESRKLIIEVVKRLKPMMTRERYGIASKAARRVYACREDKS